METWKSDFWKMIKYCLQALTRRFYFLKINYEYTAQKKIRLNVVVFERIRRTVPSS